MPRLSCLDEVEISAPLSVVYGAVIDYPAWQKWNPAYRCSITNGSEIREGSHVLHEYGYKRFIISRFERSIDKISPGNEIRESYIGGNLRGTGYWKFVENDGVTTATYGCVVDSNSIFTHISFRLLSNRAHSLPFASILKKLKSYCEEQGSS